VAGTAKEPLPGLFAPLASASEAFTCFPSTTVPPLPKRWLLVEERFCSMVAMGTPVDNEGEELCACCCKC